MKCRVMPISGAELSYRVKCVDVENERVFGDVVVTHQTSSAAEVNVYRHKKQNLVQQYLDGPDFLELNRPGDQAVRRRCSYAVFGSTPAVSRKIVRSKSLDYPVRTGEKDGEVVVAERQRKTYPVPLAGITSRQELVVSSLVDQLLVDIYGAASGDRPSKSESESTGSSWRSRQHQRPYLQRTRLELKSTAELRVLLGSLREHVSYTGGLLIRQLRRRDYLRAKREKLCDVVTAHLQAHSSKRSEDTRMKFNLTPQPGESGFIQWLDAMKMVAKLQGGIPAEFRRKLWLTLAERHLEQRRVDWKQAEKLCFNEWSNPDDEELGIQIVKDLHRTGCSLFCGAAGRDNQAVLRRVLLGFARWNKSVGYCQGLNVLAALILQVVDRDEAAAVKVMIYLIEGVLPEGYFADSLRGLSVDMAVFRDLLRMRMPRLSRHLESLQNDAKDKATGSSYEPPLTNVFTMQWFLTLFCHCLPQDAVLRVWDLIFLEGDDVLLRTALAIWEGLSDRIMTVTSADEFYSIMGVLTREMLEFTDTNHLVKTIVSMGPLNGVTNLREKHRYNITPWARRLSDDDDSDTEDDERLAVAAAAAIFAIPRLKKSDRNTSSGSALQAVAPTNDRERLALDISTLKQQYVKLRERQRQAHIILSAACARQSMVPSSSAASQAMNHLLVGKSALVSSKGRPLGPTAGSLVARTKAAALHSSPRSQIRKDRQQQQGVTIHWKDMKKRKGESEVPDSAAAAAVTAVEAQAVAVAAPVVAAETSVTEAGGSALNLVGEGMSSSSTATTAAAAATPRRSSSCSGGAAAIDSDSDSTSTELCDEPDRLSDVDSEELTSTSDCYVMATTDDERLSPAIGTTTATGTSNETVVQTGNKTSDHLEVLKEETSIAEITDQIRRLSADDADFKTSLDHSIEEKKSSEISELFNQPTPEKKPTVLESFDIDQPTSETKLSSTTLFDFEERKSTRISSLSDDDSVTRDRDKLDNTQTKDEYGISSASHLETTDSSYGSGSVSRSETAERNYGSGSASRLKSTDDTYGSSSALRLETTDDTYGSSSTSRLKSTDDSYGSSSASRLKSTDDSYGSSSASRLKSTDDNCGISSASRLETIESNYVSGSASRLKTTDDTYDSSSASRLETTDDRYGSSSILRLKSTDDTYGSISASRLETTENNYVSGSALRLKSTNDTYGSSSALRLKATDDTYGSSSASRLETTDDSYGSSSTSRLKSTDNTYGSSSATRLETTDDSYGSSSASRLKSTDDSYQNSSASRLETTEINYDFLGLRSRVGIDGPKLGIGSATIESVDEKSSEVNGSVPMVAKADVGDNVETTTRSDVTYSTRSSYVIGHLPIAPMSVEARKNCSRVSPDTFVSRDEVGAMRDRLERDTFTSSLEPPLLSPDTKFSSYKLQLEPKRSPKTPESTKSFSSGETMGPDSVTSSLAVSPKTPLRSDSRGFALGDKSMVSSVSSDSKTLTIRSIDSEVVKKPNETSGDKSVTPSTDSLMQVKSTEPPCSSTESFCSPTKLKSSERSFSSDLQSPISANSIKYTANYSYKSDGVDLQKPSAEIGPVTSPFYPILNPNKKTPSPYGEEKSRTSRNVDVLEEFRDITQDRDMKQSLETKTPTQAFDVSKLINSEENISIKVSSDTDSFKGSLRKLYTFELDDDSVKSDDKNSEKDMGRTSAFESYRKSKFDDESQETDTLSPLPRSQFENRSDIFERSRGRSLDGKLETLEISGKSYERSSSSLEKRFPDMLLSPSMEDFANSVKKRSSDVLEDLRHLEAKTIKDGEIDPSMLTRKTSFIWEDLMNLEARRQDTFSDSASGFSRQRIDVPGISISSEGRKTYIVEPKINIDESSDSILKTVTYKSSNGCTHDDDDDDGESKLGVWTKVKPRKRNDNGRRSSDRALKIIQENSAILQKILTCQARKRLPDLEEISKEITISPINEEISKIFSPILEKMGLNEHEINEELARINFKDLDRNTTTTTASEFDAKINDELSKLSLIGDNEEVAYLPDVDDISTDYLVARDAFIDRQINEELSKLLANYEEDSPITLQKGSSSLNASDDLSTCSTNVYSYKSSNDSLDMKSDLGSKDPLHPMIYPDNPIPYVPRNDYTTSRTLSAKSDVDIYRELEKLDKISYAQALPPVNTEITHQDIIPPSIPYISDILRSPKIDYPSTVIEKQPTYDISPLKSPYDSPYSSSTLQTSTFDYKSRISPRKTPSNPYSVRSYEPKGTLDTGFENSTFELTSRKAIVPTTLNYEYGPKKHILSKEHLEFRVKYDQEEDLTTTTKKSMTRDIDLKLSPFQTDIAKLDKGAAYYSNKQVITPTKKYTSNKDDRTALTSNVDLGSYESNYQRRTYDNVSPANKYSMYSENYDVLRQPYKITSLEPETEVSSYLTSSSTTNSSRHRDLSPHYQYGDYTKSIGSSYATASSNFNDSLTTTTMRSKTTYSDITPTDSLNCRKSNLTLGNVGESKQTIGDSDVKYNFDGSPSPKSLGFSPFPVRNSQRKPKELALKLGLYSPTNTVQSKRS